MVIVLRLIKCSAEDPELANEAMMRIFFEKTLPRDRTFNFDGKIGEDSLFSGDILLFQYGAKLRYIGKAASGRLNNPPGGYEHYFLIDPDSLYHAEEIHYLELQKQFESAGVQKILSGQAWTIIPNSPDAELVVEKLKRSKVLSTNGEGGDLSADDEELLSIAAGKVPGPGYQRNVERKIATELHAMEMARAHFERHWDIVEDVSKDLPYDLHCLRENGQELRVEVKGTTGDGNSVILTSGEVENALKFAVALYVLTYVKLIDSAEGIKANDGMPVIYDPWKLDPAALKALQYKYSLV
jgi:hypothetical protein